MKRPYFKACNHGCVAAKLVGQDMNGPCRFPRDLEKLKRRAGYYWSCGFDPDIRKFAYTVLNLLCHIDMKEVE